MCGIAGFINRFSDPRQSTVYLHSMLESLEHRGPDGLGVYQDDRISFGMRRLSIIGGDQGKQPKSFAEGTSHLIFNGEIYNYLEILKGSNNSQHHTEISDTDALVSILKRHGRNGLPALNGMFAAALWSSTTKKLLLFRDRLGKKPLYYFWDKKNFAFASEIKAFKTLPFFQSDINHDGLSHYLTFRYIPNKSSIYKNIHKVKPGHWLEFDTIKQTAREERWWTIPKPTTLSQATSRLIPQSKKFEKLFENSVELRLRADVNVGIFFEWGIGLFMRSSGRKKNQRG